MEKISSEIREAFGLSRDDIKCVKEAKLINPNDRGQGRASLYSEKDISILLDIKLHLMAGYRISEMGNVITKDYDSEKAISNQIYLYKKRICMLEFIRTIREDYKKIDNINQEKFNLDMSTYYDQNDLPQYGSEEFFELWWLYIKLFFIIDFISRKESLEVEDVEIKKRFLLIIDSIKKLAFFMNIEVDKEFNQDLAKILMDIADKIGSTNEEICKEAEEFVDEIEKENIVNKMKKYLAEAVEKSCDIQIAEAMSSFINHGCDFFNEYFLNKQEIYYMMVNLSKFIKYLDKEKLSKGVISIQGGK